MVEITQCAWEVCLQRGVMRIDAILIKWNVFRMVIIIIVSTF